LTTHNRQTSMPLAEFEPAIPAGDRPQTHALDRSALESAFMCCYSLQNLPSNNRPIMAQNTGHSNGSEHVSFKVTTLRVLSAFCTTLTSCVSVWNCTQLELLRVRFSPLFIITGHHYLQILLTSVTNVICSLEACFAEGTVSSVTHRYVRERMSLKIGLAHT
jgi:hypothetical protein